MKCRFVVLGDGKVYTTANELGSFLISKGVKFKQFSDDSFSYHFGTVFNERLITGLSKLVKSGATHSYGYMDFPKLVQSKGSNDMIIQSLITYNMCETSSVAPLVKGSDDRGLDIYTFNAFGALAESYGVSTDSTDWLIMDSLSIPPVLEKTQRVNRPSNTTQKSLFSAEV